MFGTLFLVWRRLVSTDLITFVAGHSVKLLAASRNWYNSQFYSKFNIKVQPTSSFVGMDYDYDTVLHFAALNVAEFWNLFCHFEKRNSAWHLLEEDSVKFWDLTPMNMIYSVLGFNFEQPVRLTGGALWRVDL
jgi:hypothetical protein